MAISFGHVSRSSMLTKLMVTGILGLSPVGMTPMALATPDQAPPEALVAPNATRFLQTGGGRIAYDDVGAGPVVLCAPSLGDVRGEYRFLTPLLVAAGYRVVTMDLRGLGESSTGWSNYSVEAIANDMLALARELDAGPITLVGCSMAGGAAVVAAAEAPELVSRVVLIDAFVRNVGPSWLGLALGSVFSGFWGAGLWCSYYSSLYPTAKPADFTPYTAALKANLSEGARLAAVREMIASSKAASEQRLAKVHVPVLALMGTRDPDFSDPAAEGQFQVEHLGAELHMIEGAGHYPHAEMPDATGRLIVRFLGHTQKAASRGS